MSSAERESGLHTVCRATAAPVLFFFFNRPHYTRQVWEQIRLARPKRLLLVADGARDDVSADQERCAETMSIVEGSIDWACEVERNYSPRNLGARDRIASGLAWAFERVDRAIILEDDCLPSEGFFEFCGELLDMYQDDARIGMITGVNYRACSSGTHGSTYFGSRHASIWGWATWRRAFSGYDPAMSAWRATVGPPDIRSWFTDWRSRMLHTTMFDLGSEGGIETWDIAWCLHMARRRMISLVPAANLISNIGIEGTRGRKGDANNLMPFGRLDLPLRHPPVPPLDAQYDCLVAKRHRLFRDWLWAKWRHRVRRLVGLVS